MADRLLTVREFAEQCSLTEKYVRQLIQSGRLRRLKLGTSKQSCIRIRESEIERIFRDPDEEDRKRREGQADGLLADEDRYRRAIERALAM